MSATPVQFITMNKIGLFLNGEGRKVFWKQIRGTNQNSFKGK
ncbi:hypothetical protein RSSM_01330 [Rhodopirellula sallentina SM41]|uniref:Uncharacterized protein n=1 Tax=Rhodopirellula sallentina SM41 TaxID=1263870 RepID=M5U7J0_9BACT|nr:hypothetical protein RSSM_01330 [Rhodopirellula sallentina SM41]